MLHPLNASRRATRATNVARGFVGLIWLAGAAFNGLVTLRMADPFGWLVEGSPFRVYQWFFGEVAGAHPAAWTVLLIAGEATIGVLTLARGGWAGLGLAGGVLFSAFLFLSGTSFTLVMGPYAVLLAWLARHDYPDSLIDSLRSRVARRTMSAAAGATESW